VQLEDADLQCRNCQRWLDPSLDSTLNADAPPLVLPPRTTSGLAIASLMCGIFGIGPGSIAAVILGHLALRQIRRDPFRLTGKRMAKAGIVLGWVGIVGLVILIFLGVYFWKVFRPHPQKPRSEQIHLVYAPITPSPGALQSAALARDAISRGVRLEAAYSCVVISHDDGSANSRLTN